MRRRVLALGLVLCILINLAYVVSDIYYGTNVAYGETIEEDLSNTPEPAAIETEPSTQAGEDEIAEEVIETVIEDTTDISGEETTEAITTETISTEILEMEDFTPPSIPMQVEASKIDSSTISITWEESVDESGINYYEIYRNNVMIGTSTSCNYSDSAISDGMIYSYQIRALDNAGNYSDISEVAIISTELSAPTNIILSAENNKVYLSWDNSANAESYEIQINNNTIIESSVNEYVYTASTGELCSFKIRSKASSGVSEWSESYSIKLLETVSGIQCVQDVNNLNISWNQVVGAQQYEVVINGQSMGYIDVTNYVLENYSNSLNYTVSVRAISGNAKGDFGTKIYPKTTMTNLSGTISSNTVLTKANSPYNLNASLTINPGVTLTVEPGVIIRSSASTNKISIKGILNAIGNEYEPIIFTSKDDNSANKWTGIVVESTGEMTGEYLEVRYGGYYNKYSNIYTEGNLSLSNSKISNSFSSNFNIVVNTTGNKTVNIFSNTISNDDNAIKIEKFDQGVLKIESNEFINIKYCVRVYNLLSDIFQNIKNNSYTNTQFSGIHLYSSPVVNWTLSENNYYLENDITVSESILLKINSGAIIKANLRTIYVNGTLEATGTETKPVCFSALSNDSIYYWGGIKISPTGSMNADYIDIKKGLNSNIYNQGNLVLRNSKIDYGNQSTSIEVDCTAAKTVIIDNNEILNEVDGIKITNYQDGDFSIRNNKLRNLTYPVSVYNTNKNIFVDIENNSISNTSPLARNGICIFGTMNIDWTLSKNRYFLMNSLIVGTGKTLTLNEGANIICDNTVKIDVQGKIISNGTKEKPVIITDASDTEYGNGPIGHWSYIYVSALGEMTANHTKIRYGGCGNEAHNENLWIEGKLSLSNSEVAYSMSKGVYFNTSINPYLKNNSFTNMEYGVVNANESIQIDATQNYWGDERGPSILNGKLWTDAGTKILGNIIYAPFLGATTSSKEYLFGTGEGVYAPTGNFSKNFTDLSIKMMQYSIDITRSYNSQDFRDTTAFGKGWSFNYESTAKVSTSDPEKMEIRLPDGSMEVFTINADGTYSAKNTRNKFVKLGDNTYILETKEQIKFEFNQNGYLRGIKDKNNNSINIVVNADGRVQSITDETGRNYLVNYTNDKITSIIDSAGREVRYEYENEMLCSVTDSMGISTYYNYDVAGNLAEIINNNNETTERIEYDLYLYYFRVSKHTDETGNIQSFTYDDAGGKTIITDSNNKETVQWYNPDFLITTNVDAEGRETVIEYFLDENGASTYFEQKAVTDRNGKRTEYERDERGNIIEIMNPDYSNKEYVYDDKNNIIRECDEEENYTYYIYDTDKINLLKVVKPLNGTDFYEEGISNPDDFAITSYEYYNEGENGYLLAGQIKNIYDQNGNITHYSYDQYGNINSITDGEGNVTQYEYNSIGYCTKTISPKGEITLFQYDLNGNIEKAVQNGGETSRITYDSLGRKDKEISPNQYNPSDDDIENHSYNNDVGTRYTYYKDGSLHTITDAENNTTTYVNDYYGNVIKEIKPNNSEYHYEYDKINRLTEVYFKSSPSGVKVLQKEIIYSIEYNGDTKKVEKIYLNDIQTASTTYIYDYAQRLIKQIYPNGSAAIITYNADGTVKKSTSNNGNTIWYEYDPLNRVSKQWVYQYNNLYAFTEYIYDKAGNVLEKRIGKEGVALYSIASDNVVLQYVYDDNNKVVTIMDNEGRKTEYAYDENGNVINEKKYINDIDFVETEYSYNYFNKLAYSINNIEKGSIYGNDINDISQLELITEYQYDANGNLIKEKNPKNIEITYTYDNLNRQISSSMQDMDEYNVTAALSTFTTYDYLGNVLSFTDANGNRTQYEYNSKGLLVKTIDPDGGVKALYYDRAGRILSEVSPGNYIEGAALDSMSRTKYSYDNMNNVILKGNVYYDTATAGFVEFVEKAYQYDNAGNVTKEVDAIAYELAAGTTIAEKISNAYKTEYHYNAIDKPIIILTPEDKEKGLNFSIRTSYDALGRKITEENETGAIITYYYDNADNIVKQTVKKNSASQEQIISQASYDLLGNKLSSIDGLNNVTEYEYNKIGKIRTIKLPGDASIDGNIIKHQYDILLNQVYSIDSKGRETISTLNNRNMILSETIRNVDGSNAITISKAYDKNGNIRFETDGNGNIKENIYDGLNRLISSKITIAQVLQETVFEYDKNSNQTKKTDWLGNVYENRYDSLNRLVEKTDPYGKSIEKYEYNSNHAQIKSYDALGNCTNYIYDKENRLIKTINPLGNETTTTYDLCGKIGTKTDGEGNISTYSYDEFGRLKSVVNALGETTAFTYDLNGNLTAQTDGKGNTITYKYNSRNLLMQKIENNGENKAAKTESYTYNADGNMVTKLDKNGTMSIYEYDIQGRLITDSAGTNTVSYTYDNNSNQLTVTDATGTTARTYDEAGRVISKTVPVIGTISFEYDITIDVETGERKEISTDSKGNVTQKVYDKAGRLKKVITGTDITTYSYYDNGSLKSTTYPDGSKEEYTYDNDNQLITLKNTKSDNTVLDMYTYYYDNAGNQTGKHEIISGIEKGTTLYTYDELNRLETVTEPGGIVTSYTYDGSGNRLTETVSHAGVSQISIYSYDDQNRLTGITVKADNIIIEERIYQNDNNGNQLSVLVKEYENGTLVQEYTEAVNTYNTRNQLVFTTTSDGNTQENIYNGEGYRVEKTTGGITKHYLYENDKIILETDELGNQLARNVYGTNLLMRTAGEEAYYYMYNGHADVTALMDVSTGSIAAAYYYDAFGNIIEMTGNADNNIMYAGYQYDEETKMYYLNARMYDPKTGRFLQEDTYGGNPNDPLSLNRYTYCANSPLIYYDPTGHIFEEISSIAKGIKKGLYDIGERAIRGTWDMAKTTTKEIGNLFKNDPIGKVKQIGKDIKWLNNNKKLTLKATKILITDLYNDTINIGKQYLDESYNKFTQEDLEGKTRILTNVIGEVGLCFIPITKISKVTKIGEISKATKVINTLDKIDEFTEVINIAEKSTRSAKILEKFRPGFERITNSRFGRILANEDGFLRFGNNPMDEIVDAGSKVSKGGLETGIIAKNGIKIEGFTSHGVDRAIGDGMKRAGVKPESILDAIKNPLKINDVVTDQFGRQSQRFIGETAEVVINPLTGKIVSINPTSSSKAAKLLKEVVSSGL